MTNPQRYYITTAISYPNGAPHMGHAYELIATDALARFQRLDGREVFFLTGTDEHGQKMLQTARREGLSARELADRNSERFRHLATAVDASNDDFIRTTEERHRIACQELWRRMEAAGDIYRDSYAGWYSVRDEAYYDEAETEVRPDGIRYGPQGTPVEWVEEESFFFRLSAYGDRLLAHYEAQPDFIGPETRRNEVVAFVRQGLRDLSMSRTTFEWGIPVPDAPGHVMYVWVDALTNYLTATGWPAGGPREAFWPADLHIIGKDIVRFHAVYWPAFLMSAGIPLPKRVYGHGFLFNRGEKMSKSVGNVLDPFAVVETYGVDATRYFFLREVPFGQDGSYSHEAIIGRINADLANDLGNLAQRSLSMIAKHCEGRVPETGALDEADRAILTAAYALVPTVRDQLARQQISRGLDAVWAVIADANRYFAAAAPWVLRKSSPERMASVLWTTAEVLRVVGILLQFVMPGAAGRLLDQLGVEVGARMLADAVPTGALVGGNPLPAPEPVFPRYVEDRPDAA